MAFLLFIALFIPLAHAFAQDAIQLPKSHLLTIPKYEYQSWNNCGPATLTNALSFYGYMDKQARAAAWLKPNYEDKNVSPWQMIDFVNTQIPELPIYAINRVGGTITLLKTLIANNFPVIIEEGYDPPPHDLGWMGHYLLLTGYDDSAGVFISQDSYIGPNTHYTYDHVDEFWRHFNRTYIVVYRKDREADVTALLGGDADPHQNTINALQAAREEAVANPNDPFAWFNMGTNFVALGMFPEAATAYDQARNVGGGLPWRMLWYEFGPYEAYLAVGRYDDVIKLAQATLNDGGGQYVEETFYYAGLAREGLGDNSRAVLNLNTALQFNPNFSPARDALSKLTTTNG
jgi:tetratricopeptide (TPR) repeat protein